MTIVAIAFDTDSSSTEISFTMNCLAIVDYAAVDGDYLEALSSN